MSAPGENQETGDGVGKTPNATNDDDLPFVELPEPLPLQMPTLALHCPDRLDTLGTDILHHRVHEAIAHAHHQVDIAARIIPHHSAHPRRVHVGNRFHGQGGGWGWWWGGGVVSEAKRSESRRGEARPASDANEAKPDPSCL